MSNGPFSVPAVGQQIELAEVDQAAQFGTHPHQAVAARPSPSGRSGACARPRAVQRGRADRRRAARRRQHVGVDVGGEQAPAACARRTPRTASSRSNTAPRRWTRPMHHIVSGVPARRRALSAARPAAGSGAPRGRTRSGWWSAQLMNACHSSGMRRLRVRGRRGSRAKRVDAGLAQAARRAGCRPSPACRRAANAGALVDQAAHALEVVAREIEFLACFLLGMKRHVTNLWVFESEAIPAPRARPLRCQLVHQAHLAG